MKIAIYPGTFDPITNGHLDVVERAARIFEKVIITVAKNPKKRPLFSTRERVEMISAVVKELPHHEKVTVESFTGLIVDYAQSRKASAIIRGLRAVSDFEYELQMAQVNRKLARNITTVFLMPHENYTYLNSTIVREVASFGGDVSCFVPPLVEKKLKAKL